MSAAELGNRRHHAWAQLLTASRAAAGNSSCSAGTSCAIRYGNIEAAIILQLGNYRVHASQSRCLGKPVVPALQMQLARGMPKPAPHHSHVPFLSPRSAVDQLSADGVVVQVSAGEAHGAGDGQ